MSCLGRTEPLAITGPQGLHEAMTPLIALAGPTAFPVRLIALPPEGLAMDALHAHWPGDARLSAFATEHRVPSQGYAFTLARPGRFMPERARALGVPVKLWGLLQRGQTVEFGGVTVAPDMVLGAARRGLKFVFTGDTAYCPSLVEAARGADLMICEATYALDEQAARAEAFGHMNFRRAAQAAAQAEVGEAWLAHYSQMIEDPEAYFENVRKVFPRARCGRDGMRKTLRFAEDDQQLTINS